MNILAVDLGGTQYDPPPPLANARARGVWGEWKMEGQFEKEIYETNSTAGQEFLGQGRCTRL